MKRILKPALFGLTLIVLEYVFYLFIYRSPYSNYEIFLVKLEMILQQLCKSKAKVVICGDINLNYMENCLKKVKLEDILSSYNLSGIITFPTIIGPNYIYDY
jgi:hypothetical protein